MNYKRQSGKKREKKEEINSQYKMYALKSSTNKTGRLEAKEASV